MCNSVEHFKGNRWIVITTINPPTKAVEFISELCTQGWSAVVIGDTRTPADWKKDGITYLSTDMQKKIWGGYADQIPYRHYCRKNLGYLYAISQGAELILETDDDNIPYESFGKSLSKNIRGHQLNSAGWVNVYNHYTDKMIWPRGLPLDEVHSPGIVNDAIEDIECPVQQFLADLDPDVDAIYRMLFKDPVVFEQRTAPLILAENTWSPFNSQNTLFFKEVFPLLYLPCHVTFRMTDIWRSFVVQQTLWIHGFRLSFSNATVKQVRNEHNLMQDFRAEVPGYLDNNRIVLLLEEAALKLKKNKLGSIASTAFILWCSLIDNGIVPEEERPILENWFNFFEDNNN